MFWNWNIELPFRLAGFDFISFIIPACVISTSSCGLANPQIVTSLLRCKTKLSEKIFGSVTFAEAVFDTIRKRI
jgi:hypothetical protein